MNPFLLFLIYLIIFLWGTPVYAAQAGVAESFEECAQIEDDVARLRCYDGLTGRKQTENSIPPEEMQAESSEERESPPPSYLSSKWQLDENSRRQRFAIMPHRANYILPFTHNFSQDKETYEAAKPGTELQDTETKFQLSLKVKLWEGILGEKMDLWFAYTQLSFWQFFNSEFSSPFRETNYEPEILLNFRTNIDLLGLIRNRFIQVGFNHQSNGRSEPLSRSWNRVVANFGFEHGAFNLILKTWLRIPESADKDDNRDISSYLGYGEIWAGYLWKDYHLAVMFRNNLRVDENRSALQVEFSFPLIERLNGYFQYFVGFGESLLDYNHYANRIGFGIMVKDW
jgi:phospholipase A1